MGRPRRQLRATEQETCSPPTALENGHFIAQVIKAEGNNLYTVTVPSEKKPLLVELPARFRSTIWIKRGGYVVIDRSAFEGRNNKLAGEIANIVRDEKQWRKEPYWPIEFSKKTGRPDSDDEESIVGQMPPSDESEVE